MRPIDADAVKDVIAELNENGYDISPSDLAFVRNILLRMPTIDAVPVVRCKDCRWKEEEQPGMVYCPATVGGWVDEDWFCKGGERSEE